MAVTLAVKKASVRLRQGRLDEAQTIVEGVAAALPELGSNRTAVYLALADCFIVKPQGLAPTLKLISHLTNEADDPRYEADVAVALVSLRHSIDSCDGSCHSISSVVSKWDEHGQHFETIKRRVLLAVAAYQHDPPASLERCKEALRCVSATNQAWYLRFFVRPLTALAPQLVQSPEDVEALCVLLEADP